MVRIIKLMARFSIAYAASQVLTGIEIGVLAAMLVVLCGWPLSVAMGVTFPLGLPLVGIQMMAIVTIQRWVSTRLLATTPIQDAPAVS